MWQPGMNVDYFINARPHLNEYSVYFFNNRELNILQIYQIFSYYGKVKNIKPSNSNTGFVFVNYETEAEARRCVVGMMYQNFIQLCIFAHKNPNQISSNGNFSVQNNHKNPTTFFSPRDDAIHDRTERNVNTEILSPTVSAFFDESKKTPALLTSQKLFNLISPNFPSTSVAGTNSGEIVAGNRTKSLVDLREVAKDEQKKYYRRKSLKNTETKDSTQTLTKSVAKDQEIVAAQEVIVGNIPEAYGVPYVLHILEKYNPICISSIKILWKHDLRYCHVYFKTPRDAEAAEANYDTVELNGKPLIVMRPVRLAVHAQNCLSDK